MPVNPSDILSGIIRVLDPANAVVSAGKIVTFNGPVAITNSTGSQQATYNPSDVGFNGQPTASFAGAQHYPLGDLSAFTGAEFFAVLETSSDPGLSPNYGLAKFGPDSPGPTLYRHSSGIHDPFASTVRRQIDVKTHLAQPHIYNPRSRANEWALEINGVQQLATAINTLSLTSSATFGIDASWPAVLYFSGKLAYAVLCDRVQTPQARAAMVAYLKQRFAIVTPQDYVSLLGSNLVGFWHQAQGVSVSAGWADVVSGRVAALTGGGAAPTYAVDSTRFRGRKVVQLAAAGQYLQTAASEMIAAGARPYVFAVQRLRATASWADMWALNSTDDMSLYVAGSGGNATAQFKHPAEVSVNGGAQDLLVHYDEAWLDGTVGRLRRDGVDSVVAAAGSIAPAVDRLRIGNGQGALSTFCIGICAAPPTEDERAALAALIANDIESIPYLFAGVLTGYYARDNVNAGPSSWPGIGGTLSAVGSPQYKKDGFNFRGASVPTTTAAAGFKTSAPGAPFMWAEYVGYVIVMGRFADLSASGCLIDFGGVRIYHDVGSHEFKAVWMGTELGFGRADTEAHVFEIRTTYINETLGSCSVYLDGALISGPVSVSLLASDATEISVGARLDGSEKIAAKVSRIIVANDDPGDYYSVRTRWLLQRIDSATVTLESILGSNLSEVWYANDAALVGDDVNVVTGRRKSQQIAPSSTSLRPAFRYYDSVLHSTAIDCVNTGRFLRNIALASNVAPSGSRPFAFAVGRLRTIVGTQTLVVVRAVGGVHDARIQATSTPRFRQRLSNPAGTFISNGPVPDLDPHIFGTFTDAAQGSALWFDGATHVLQPAATAAITADLEWIAVGGYSTAGEWADLTFSALGLCTNCPTTQELAALNAYFRTKYLEIEGVTIDVPAISDAVDVSDSALRRPEYLRRPSADAVVVTELLRRTLTYGRRPSDATVVTEQLRRALAYGRRPSDTAVVTDLLRRALTYGRATTDAGVVTEQLQRVLAYGRSPSDTAVATDSITRSHAYHRRLATDAASALDQARHGAVYARARVDATTTPDAVSTALAYRRRAVDAVSAPDKLLLLVARVLADSSVVTDQLRRALAITRQLTTETILTLDTIRVSLVLRASIVDSVTGTDAVTIGPAAFARAYGDSVASIQDGLAVVRDSARRTDDAVSLVDQLCIEVSSTENESIGVVDALTLNVTKTLALSGDVVAAFDSLRVTRALGAIANDTIDTTSATRLALVYTRARSEVADAHDALIRETASVVLNDSALTTDDAQGVVDRALRIADVIVLTDTVQPAQQWARVTGDAVSAVDSARTASSAATWLGDDAYVADTLRIAQVLARTLAQAIALADELSPASATHRALTDALTTTEAIVRAHDAVRRPEDESIGIDDVVNALVTRIVSIELFDDVETEDGTAHTAGLQKQISDAIALVESLAAAIERGAWISDHVSVEDEIDNGVRAMHLIFGSSTPGPLFMSGTEPGRLVFSTGGDDVPIGFVVRFGDFVATSDSIFAEAS